MEGLHVRSEGRHLFITVTAFFYSLRAAFCVCTMRRGCS
jgi:hypothetical protein